MAFTDAQILAKKNQIQADLGEPADGSGFLSQVITGSTTNIDRLWDNESGRGGSNLELAYLFVKRAALNLTLGSIWRGQYIPVGLIQHKDLSGMVKFLQSERDTVQGQIEDMPSIGRINTDWMEPDIDEFGN